MATIVNPTLTERIVRGLRKAATEIEEFTVQASLGEMEARELFEKNKKKYRKFLFEAILQLEKAKDVTKATVEKIRGAVDELQVQLALGRAESRVLFLEHRKKKRAAGAKAQAGIKKDNVPPQYKEPNNTELQKQKIKLDILKLKYKAKNAFAKQEMKGRKRDFTNRLQLVRDKFRGRKANRWKVFNDEISEAWVHLKKAFTK